MDKQLKAIEAAKCCEKATNSKPVCDDCIEESEGYMSQYDDRNPQDNAPQSGSATYIETVYGTRRFARSLILDDAQSIMDLMDDFSDSQTAPLKDRIAELEAQNKSYREALEGIKAYASLDDSDKCGIYEFKAEQALNPKPLTDG